MKILIIILSLFILVVFSISSNNSSKQEKLSDKQNTRDSIASSNDSLSSCWLKLADLITPRNAHMAASLNNKIYVIGGYTSGTSFEEYNVSTNSWKSLADMSTPREFISGCELNGKIYAIGGWLKNITYAIVEEYDPVKNSWSTKSPMPTRRWGHSAVVINEKIYIIGGALDWPISEYYSSIEIYDPKTDTWTTKECNPTNGMIPRWGQAACVVNEKVYVIGGVNAPAYPGSGQIFQSLSVVEEYDPLINSWKQKISMPTARWCLTAVSVNNKIYAIGGGDIFYPQNTLSKVEVYDPLTDTWFSRSNIPKGQIGAASCTLGNRIYVLGGGGLSPSDAYSDLFVYYTTCDTLK
ncbi:MAG: hypothetical protein KAR57_01465 [Bacteroidales bacterium]|nr:hypothetical protein [Bacteroidales bacterium]